MTIILSFIHKYMKTTVDAVCLEDLFDEAWATSDEWGVWSDERKKE